MDALGHHPFGHPNPPTYSTINPDDAGIPDIGRLERVLRAAEKAGVVRGGKRPIWATEFWWITRPPPNPDAVANEAQQALHSASALPVLEAAAVSVAIQYPFAIQDVPSSWALLRRRGAEALLPGLPFPVCHRPAQRARPGLGKVAKAGKVKVQAKKRGKWRTVKRTRVSARRGVRRGCGGATRCERESARRSRLEITPTLSFGPPRDPPGVFFCGPPSGRAVHEPSKERMARETYVSE